MQDQRPSTSWSAAASVPRLRTPGGGQRRRAAPGRRPAYTDGAAAARAPGPAQESLKVGFIYVVPVGDYGWSYAHDQGRKYLEKTLPDVKTIYVESVSAGADAERVLTQLARSGHKVIFATSYGYMDTLLKVAERFPDLIFMHCSGQKRRPNVGTYFGRMYQVSYLSGLVAG